MDRILPAAFGDIFYAFAVDVVIIIEDITAGIRDSVPLVYGSPSLGELQRDMDISRISVSSPV